MQDNSTRGTAFLPLFGGSPTPTFEVARAARRFPVILEWLAAGSVNLTTVRLLAPHLTPENHRSALESARGKKGEVEEIARLCPGPTQPPSELGAAGVPAGRPSGDDAAILDRALTALLTDLARASSRREKPRPPRKAGPGSRHIPAEVRRTVWVRDLGRCAFLGTSGRRCGERAFVEFHHVRPFAAGGEASVGNIELRCRRHNDYEMRATRTRTFATVSSRASRGDTFRHGALQPGLIPSRRLSSE